MAQFAETGEIKGDPQVPPYLVREERESAWAREREREERDTLVDTEDCVCFDRVCVVMMISCARIMVLSCSMGSCTPAIKTHELTALQSFRKLDIASKGRFARLAPRRGQLQITCVGWVCPLLSFPHEFFFFFVFLVPVFFLAV